jgi:limonene 1,2-monooxygenase
VIGTPDDAVEQVERLRKQTGGFGTILQLAHNWADFENTKRSYELFVRHVAPRLSGANANRAASLEWVTEHSTGFMDAARDAAVKMFQKHAAERPQKKS